VEGRGPHKLVRGSRFSSALINGFGGSSSGEKRRGSSLWLRA